MIDQSLDYCRHLVVVASHPAHVDKRWVRYEWDTFANERLSGRKDGNLITVACGSFSAAELPVGLRQTQLYYWPAHKERVLGLFGGHGDLTPQPMPFASQTALAREPEASWFVWIWRFFWRPPIWTPSPRMRSQQPETAVLVRLGDFLLRALRFYFVFCVCAYGPLMLYVLWDEGELMDLEPYDFIGLGICYWIAWLTRGPVRPRPPAGGNLRREQ